MPALRWDLLKSERLKRVRGVSFEELIAAELLAVKRHRTRSHQDLMLFWHRNYVWVVPFVRDGEDYFLKTLYPSRKYTKLYKQRGAL